MLTLTTLLVLLVTLSAYYFYSKVKKSRRYFRDAGIPYIEPHWLLGNMKQGAQMKRAFVTEIQDLYHKMEPHRFAGMYIFFKKVFVIRDPELIKSILVKDFAYFPDHGIHANKEAEPEWANNLLSMEGDEWKNLRIKLTSTFTSGKTKMMFPLAKKCAEEIKPALMKDLSDSDCLEIKDLCARYTTDVIGSCAFGIDTHSLKDPESEFRIMGKKIFELRLRGAVRVLIPNLPTWCMKAFKLQTFNQEAVGYFSQCVAKMVEYREQNNVTRGDFLDLLIAMKNRTDKGKQKDQEETDDLNTFIDQVGEKDTNKRNDVEMTIELIAAQCFLFFIGGFESTSITLSLLLFELAANPQVQSKVREDI